MRPLLIGALLVAASLTLTAAGCQPAARFNSDEPAVKNDVPVVRDEKSTEAKRLSDALAWIDPQGREPKVSVRFVFVNVDADPVGWVDLKKYWTQSNGPAQAAALIGLPQLVPIIGPTVVGPDPQVIKIKVPRGLADPTPFIPPENPPTLAKWELGRQLFSDTSWLSANGNVSCKGCHQPDKAFTDGLQGHGGFNTPTLVNVVYNSAQFWDGRATYLEEVVARSLEDEREATKPGPFRHTFGGAVDRLYDPTGKFLERFRDVFGTTPTQDTVGKALATYLRTLLAGNSLHDRALHELAQRKQTVLSVGDYEKALTPADLKTLGESRPANEVAEDLHLGYKLFNNGIKEQPLHCAKCHSGRQFTDGRFHNIGLLKDSDFSSGSLLGRIAHVPTGLRQRELFGAYKTPTLRNLLRTAPYFHNGEKSKLEDAILFHTWGFNYNSSLAREFRKGDQWSSEEHRAELKDKELRALTLFLKSLNGEEVDAAVLPLPSP